MKKFPIVLSTAMAAAFLFGAPAFAKDHGDKDAKHAEKEERKAQKEDRKAEKREQKLEARRGAYFREQDRERVRGYYVEHYGGGKGCPPGLAKKHNGCMPPGHARKWDVGSPLPRDVVVYSVPQPVVTYLPPAPVGYRYQRVGGDLVLIHVSDRVVIDIMLDVF
ncbi:MAG TPA: hypothetical protein VMZ74_08110 [Ramlibacter sp.]|nr:hypothetical protein [Ramlibacter sp.]